MRVLMVVSEAPPIVSGISRVTAQLQQGLGALGVEIDTMSANDVPRLMFGEIRLSSMLWRAPGLLVPRFDDYDVIHIHGPVPTFSDISPLLSGVLTAGRRPVVVYTHHSEIDIAGLGVLCDVYNWMHKNLAGLADQAIDLLHPDQRPQPGALPPAGQGVGRVLGRRRRLVRGTAPEA